MSMFTDGKGKIKPGWAFVFSVILGALAFLVAGNIATEAAGDHPFRRELIFRALWAVLLLGIFIWLLTVGDHLEEHRIAAQGLPRVKGWLKQFAAGRDLGFVLPAVAVAPIYFWGHFRYKILMDVELRAEPGGRHPDIDRRRAGRRVDVSRFSLSASGKGNRYRAGSRGALRVLRVVAHVESSSHGLGHREHLPAWSPFTVAYLRTRALWLPWGIHFGWNATLGLLLGLPVSGIRSFNLWIYTQPYGPKWLTGDFYGIEAAATGTAAILFGLLIVSILPVSKLPQPISQPSSEPAVESLSSIKS